MKIDIVNIDGKKVGSVDLDDAVFGARSTSTSCGRS